MLIQYLYTKVPVVNNTCLNTISPVRENERENEAIKRFHYSVLNHIQQRYLHVVLGIAVVHVIVLGIDVFTGAVPVGVVLG